MQVTTSSVSTQTIHRTALRALPVLVSLVSLSPAAFAGTSEGSDEHMLIIGVAVFFALLLGVYSLSQRIGRMMRRRHTDELREITVDTSEDARQHLDSTGLQLSQTH
jgi:hypothetical protein